MKFIIDANLPKKLSKWLIEKGFDSIHTLDLPKKNLTEDISINHLSIEEQRIVITKDKDFMNSILLKREPYKLIFISAGNLQNKELFLLLEKHLDTIINSLQTETFVEIDQNSIISHF